MNTVFCNSVTPLHKNADIHPHKNLVTRGLRNQRNNHQSGVIWLTGLSGSGKSTIATGVEQTLFQRGYHASILDGDTLRTGLNSDLDFSIASREENLRRTGEVAALFADVGHIVLASFISPHDKGREWVKNIIGENFYLVHVHAGIDDCIKRDPKGLYKKALKGEIPNFTGINQPYEIPESPDLRIDTSRNDIATCQELLLTFIETKFRIF